MNKIIIFSGDPSSINSEIIFKSWKKLKKNLKKRIYFLSNFNLLKAQFKKLKYNIRLRKVKNYKEFFNNTDLKIIDVDIKFKNPFKINKKNSSKFVIKCLNLSHNLALQKDVSGIINCTIDKNLLNKNNIGVTEYLAEKCKLKKNTEVMVIGNNKLKVSPLTTHINIKNVPKKINKKLIIGKVKIINYWFINNFKKKPRIGLLGLNPHNGEFKKDSEEKRIIEPAIKHLKKLNIKINGPLSADTVFINNYKNYEVIVGMYHDQILGPFKSIFKYDAINITLGLKYIRVSPDHGTAKNLIGKNKANIKSFLECINVLNKLSK